MKWKRFLKVSAAKYTQVKVLSVSNGPKYSEGKQKSLKFDGLHNEIMEIPQIWDHIDHISKNNNIYCNN